jgi:hypothetical protein
MLDVALAADSAADDRSDLALATLFSSDDLFGAAATGVAAPVVPAAWPETEPVVDV